ncbi:MAG TPA: hypothetical protein VIV65_04320 [Gemmatimonadaceae bacterium]
MTDPRSLADDAVRQLDRLAAAILNDVGEGPSPEAFGGIASDLAGAIRGIGVPAFSEVTGLIGGVAASLSSGAVDWSPALGGTLMAAVDDLRALVQRAAAFSAEDSEHLHQRATELGVYVKVASKPGGSSPQAEAPVSVAPPVSAPPAPPSAATPAPAPPSIATAPAPASPPVTDPTPPAPKATTDNVIPISDLFYADGQGIVSGGVPASKMALSDMLSTGLESLEKSLVNSPLVSAVSSGPTMIVPVETLTYRGRSALERANTLREQIKASGNPASQTTLDEVFDLIGLALKD